MKYFIQIIIFSILSTLNSLKACDDKSDQTLSLKSYSQFSIALKNWVKNAKTTFEQDLPKQVKLVGNNYWLYTPEMKLFAIFKPVDQEERMGDHPLKQYRAFRNLDTEINAVRLGIIFGLSDVLPKSVPIPFHEVYFEYYEKPMEGLLELPITLSPKTLPVDKMHLKEFADYILKLSAKSEVTNTHCISLAEFNDLIDGPGKIYEIKEINGTLFTSALKGSEDFLYEHYQFYLNHINYNSLLTAAFMDMLLYHRDMKSDNVMLRIDANGIGFVIIDFEYAMLPFTFNQTDNSDRQKYIQSATSVQFKPFYLDFPQADLVIPMVFFRHLYNLKKVPIKEFMLKHPTSILANEGYQDFIKRFDWLTTLATQVVQEHTPAMTLRSLHKSFKKTFNLKGKLFKEKRFYNKQRYYYSEEQFNALNPLRAGYAELREEPMELFVEEITMCEHKPNIHSPFFLKNKDRLEKISADGYCNTIF